jgi:hypothetical protein
MKPQLKLSIQEPCLTNWEAMHAVDAEKKFCTSCNKVVTDFTNMPDEELIRFMLKNKNVCGKLTTDQLDKMFDLNSKKESRFKLSQWFLLPSFLLSIPGFAQQVKDKPATNTVVVPQEKATNPEGKRMITINGTILFQGAYPDSLRPVRTVILITNGRDSVSEFSGLDGNYSISIPCFETDSITISAWENGTDEFKATVRPQAGSDAVNVDIILHPKMYTIRAITMVGGITASIGVPGPRRFSYYLFYPFRFLKYRVFKKC